MNTASRRFSCHALIFLCFFSLLALACGKQGPPRPRVTKDLFTIEESSAFVSGTCMTVQGRVNGSIRNVDRFIIELAPIRGPEDCPGCPFNAREAGEYSIQGANLDMESGGFSFSYCPSIPAEAQRWRLVVRNVYPGLPFAMTNPRIIVMTPEGAPK